MEDIDLIGIESLLRNYIQDTHIGSLDRYIFEKIDHAECLIRQETKYL